MISSKRLSSMKKSLGLTSSSGSKNSSLLSDLIHNKIVMWVLAIISFFNILGYIESNNIIISILFIMTGLIMSTITKNITIILLTTLLFTNFVAAVTKNSREYTHYKNTKENL